MSGIYFNLFSFDVTYVLPRLLSFLGKGVLPSTTMVNEVKSIDSEELVFKDDNQIRIQQTQFLQTAIYKFVAPLPKAASN